MRDVVLFIFTTLDGFISGPNGELDAVVPATEEHQYTNDILRTASALMFGRVMYEMVAPFWDAFDITDPAAPWVEVEFATIFRSTPRIVFSRTLDKVDSKAMLIKDDIASHVSRLRDQPGGPLLLGCGPDLLATFAKLDLIDEYRLIVNPTVLGSGKPLFKGIEQRIKLELLETRVFPSGSVLLRYKPERRSKLKIVAGESTAPIAGSSEAD